MTRHNIKIILPVVGKNSAVPAVETSLTRDRPTAVLSCRTSDDRSLTWTEVVARCLWTVLARPAVTLCAGLIEITAGHETGPHVHVDPTDHQ